MKATKITTEEEYQAAKKRLEKAEEMLEGKWNSEDPEIKKWIEGYSFIAGYMLDYEIEHDLLPL